MGHKHGLSKMIQLRGEGESGLGGESLGEREQSRNEPSHENDRFEKSKSQMNIRTFKSCCLDKARKYALHAPRAA